MTIPLFLDGLLSGFLFAVFTVLITLGLSSFLSQASGCSEVSGNPAMSQLLRDGARTGPRLFDPCFIT